MYAIAQVGNTMVLGGTFTSVNGVSHKNVVAFDVTSGAVSTSFLPAVNGVVNMVIAGPTAGTVYLGGAFTTINGASRPFLVLLDLTTGRAVTTFKPATFNYGPINDLILRGNRLYVAGRFTKVGGVTHDGLVTLNATTGALDPFMDVQLTGHHNDTGQGVQSAVGASDMDITTDGSTMAVVGTFKDANGLLRNQVALISLTGSSAVLDPWATTAYAPYCNTAKWDQYVRSVAFAPDGSYFAISATGGAFKGTMCDATARFETDPTNTTATDTWVDENGGDSNWGIAVTGSAVFSGGHNRWENNPLGSNAAQPGAVPRAGLEAFDPTTGRPLAWNPGRMPLGAAVYSFLGTTTGLWMGWDEDYIGDYKYHRARIAFFPYTGGYQPASTAIAGLPGNAFLAGTSSNTLTKVGFTGSTATKTSASNQGIDFSNWRGAFLVGNQVIYGYTDNFLYSRTFDGTTFGPAVKIDPYNDPLWANVQTGDGDTFNGMVPTFYGQLPKVTGMAYYQGRVYYTLSGDSHLYSKWFVPDTDIIDQTTATATSSVSFSSADGMFIAGGKLYYASKTDGDLRKVTLTSNASKAVVSGAATVVSGPSVDGVNWTNTALFLAGPPATD